MEVDGVSYVRIYYNFGHKNRIKLQYGIETWLFFGE